ncbi:MAG: hypothetical protein M3R25_10080 [Bacteroidota bacterium]|nr:hypothetical protein [Bacteroidota bacterium]
MIPSIRDSYNAQFTQERYEAFLEEVYWQFDHVPGFRIAETPVFIPADIKEKIFDACEYITDVITSPDFHKLSDASLTSEFTVPNEDAHTTFLQMDFGLCEGPDGTIVPKLIEVQGFPSLYFYQHIVAGLYRKHFDIPDSVSHLFNEFTPETYVEMLREIIVGNENPKEVVLIDIEPWKQNTQIDFHATRKVLGIHVACVSDLYKKGNQLFYENEEGNEVRVKRIYNRVIFDELAGRKDLVIKFSFTDDLDVKWVGHPNWFYRISKHTIPYLKHDYIPKTHFLNELESIPTDLENYVLKPLYSFSGSGVVFHVTPEDIEKVEDKSQYILQEKVKYIPLIRTPEEPVKVEVRIMLLWPEDAPRPIIVNNLARLSKGEMIGVKFNKDKTWVGGSVGFYSG